MQKFGHNKGYIDELFAAYRRDPSSLSEAWREFFAGYDPDAEGPVPRQAPASRPATPAKVAEPDNAEPLIGVTARIAENMVASLGVPTATSTRAVAVKLLEENRRVLNRHQIIVSGPKISFTHVIAWALVRALKLHPAMNAGFVERNGKPYRLPREGINLGLAIDMERNGGRVLLVPNIKNAERLDFPQFIAAYDDLIGRARDNKLGVDDFADTSVTLTNPGMLGTAMSVPRLMQGQGTIIGVGAIGFPAQYAGMAPEVISQLGLSKVMTITSTYDHRIIQGAESGTFLGRLERLLQGDDGFYEEIFTQLGLPREPLTWSGDRNPQVLGGGGDTEAIAKQAGVLQLIRSFRVRGHLWADLDPLGYEPVPNPELELSHYGLSVWDLDRRFISGGLGGRSQTLELREILDTLQRTYCRRIGVEYMHIQDTAARTWLQERLESEQFWEPFSRDDQIRILKKLNAAEAFETFLGTNYIGQKRFSLEGAETLIPMLDFLLADSARDAVEDIVIGMAHRGRLNVLANVIGKSYGQIFREFEGDLDPETTHGSGDVKYHLGASGIFEDDDGRQLRIAVASNPSHLEAVNPVVEGMVRALQDRRNDTDRERALPLLIHGDAAFAGQGVVAETLNLSQLEGYRTGGTVHVIVNNKIGFTTGPADARSSHYSTDVAKMLRSPIFHVNGDHPEAAVRVIRLALEFRQTFKRDVVVDLVCYRRWGHNEGDDPSYTHPILYAKIKHHRSVRKLYTEQLLRRGDFDIETGEKALQDFSRRLQEVHDEVRQAQEQAAPAEETWFEHVESPEETPQRPAARVDRDVIERVLEGLDRTPDGFEPHPKLAKLLAQRRVRFHEDRIDWALAEALAFGSLVLEGTPVRLSGEDSGRGTFSQRHSALYDYRTAEPYVPLNHLAPDQAPFHVFDSLLSEFAVLGFDYGYTVLYPETLVLWEAQFGDFVNGAQVIIDQFITSAEAKWNQRSGLVMLLPHGHEGQGPEHSSARLERFLQLAAEGNIQVVYPSTPAQYFHLLRAQARLEHPTPLIVATPKSLLRHKACVSAADEFSSGDFRSVVGDPRAPDVSAVRRIVLCTGKVYYELDAVRESHGAADVAVVRVEQLYPFARDEIAREFERYAAATEVVWVQEEPRNMGAWSFLKDPLQDLLGDTRTLEFVGRPRRSSPATGSHRRHLAMQERLMRQALRLEAGEAAGAHG